MSLTAESDFLNEIKKQFDRDLYFRENLDKKANTMMYFAMAILTILTLLTLTQISSLSVYTFGIIATTIVLTVASMVFFIQSSSLKTFRFPYGHEAFFYKNPFDENKTTEFINMPVVDAFRKSTKEYFTEHQIKEYLMSMRHNADELETKAFYMKIGFPLLILSIIGLGVSVLSILFQFAL